MTAKMLERDLEAYGTRLLELDLWRSFKMEQNFSERKMKVVGERGMPDRLYIRYCFDSRSELAKLLTAQHWHASCEVVWCEWKRRGGKAKAHQLDWIRAERARGALVWLAGVDFEATPEGFYRNYSDSGLMRKQISAPGDAINWSR